MYILKRAACNCFVAFAQLEALVGRLERMHHRIAYMVRWWHGCIGGTVLQHECPTCGVACDELVGVCGDRGAKTPMCCEIRPKLPRGSVAQNSKYGTKRAQTTDSAQMLFLGTVFLSLTVLRCFSGRLGISESPVCTR